MPKAKVNGINLYYESTGRGFPVVLTHGFSATHAMWAPQVSLASEYRLVTYDVRGHGDTDSPPTQDQYSADIVVEDLFQLVKSLGINKAVFGGLSMGGYISLRFYLQHPETVVALMVMDTGPGYRNPERMAEWNKSREEMAKRLETEGMSVLEAQARAAGRQEVNLGHKSVQGLAHMSRKVVGQHDSWVIQNLDKVKVPTLVLVGENDTQFIQAALYMAKTIPGAKHVVVPRAGHPANMDNTEFFNKTVSEFLRGLKLPGRE